MGLTIEVHKLSPHVSDKQTAAFLLAAHMQDAYPGSKLVKPAATNAYDLRDDKTDALLLSVTWEG